MNHLKYYLKACLLRVMATLVRNDGPKVLYYHDIGVSNTPMGTSMDLFKAHVEAVKESGWFFTDSVPIRERELMICFDDGFRGILDARDYIVAEGLRPTIFIAVDLIGTVGYLTWEEVLDLQKEGFIFQCHSWSHQTLAGPMIDESPKGERSDEWYRHELLEAKQELENRLGCAISSLCFPCGYFSNDVVKRATEAGYRYLYASYPGNVPSISIHDTKISVIPRCLVQNLRTEEMISVLHGGMSVLRNRYIKQHFFN